jgi:hypothetical protein
MRKSGKAEVLTGKTSGKTGGEESLGELGNGRNDEGLRGGTDGAEGKESWEEEKERLGREEDGEK